MLVDVGNSRVKWRMTGERNAAGVCPVDATLDGVPPTWRSLPKPACVLVSLVANPARRDAMTRWCREAWDVAPRFARSTSPVPGMTNGYADPAQLGVDRWLAMVAARRLGDEPAVVIDCGTAITMDLVDRSGVFVGGMIVPGRRVLESVFQARVPYLAKATERFPPFPANNTADGIALGIGTALVASMDRFIDNSRALTGDEPVIRVTGGDGPWLRDHWGGKMTFHENLVLDGLYTLMEFHA